MKKILKSTRFKVYFSLFLFIVVIPILFSSAIGDDTAERDIYIPKQHQHERFKYLEVSNLEANWSQDTVGVTTTLTNNSYVYDLVNVVIRIDFNSDEGDENIITSIQRQIGTIASKDEYLFNEVFDREDGYQVVGVTIESVELAQKNK